MEPTVNTVSGRELRIQSLCIDKRLIWNHFLAAVNKITYIILSCPRTNVQRIGDEKITQSFKKATTIIR
jgi:hypothetical protein